ncbi:hydroxymethylglutaryl-CoA lyase [Roseivirga pacifica]|uniref:hydroxymethylglutaryl-CoA lyase n=1 Tax=Roseivirga pacifica TaxID=1267423 RepID=UPI002094C747|nr:hydroxymethylglutaryl-CoA lyase [Roseivirga pacifica]MCO6360679.1 hydroxymethylglutaryl-CoA lyase [Roseivirga pacifica]MCO6368568.1 hydroxymethylglutaryl-CoA lyase [Roseivirga pacifica]MCO6372710.1 hydroxymethylglutaryl-CoA lyase [Roseivirga pacifica]MCO6376768.1 hydroxymethylglutaryl-CoA lyase [Roseivirga pacifica]MCO6377952.1 hydroxymethylglutaryl-CoA lyase [Roseivirga pacifica]
MKIIECPRDAMQGLHDFIPTEKKAAYINQLLKVGFDTIDFGSFVSPKAIPQMRDTAEVLGQLELSQTSSKLLAIVANVRGAEDAARFDEIDYLGFPLSISEQFQQRNTNKSIAEALVQLEQIQSICVKQNKTLVTYISMGFGNPYNEPFNEEIVAQFVQKLDQFGVSIASLSDTIGVADSQLIKEIFSTSITAYPTIEFGAHFHSTPQTAVDKISAAYEAGCRRFDSAIKGFGGCPMAKDDLTGNIATEQMIAYFDKQQIETGLNQDEFARAMEMSLDVFPLGV